MPDITARLSTALADRYRIERHLGEGVKESWPEAQARRGSKAINGLS